METGRKLIQPDLNQFTVELFKKSFYFVEATDFEFNTISKCFKFDEHLLEGRVLTFGYISNFPVVAQFRWSVIGGKHICFFEPTSRVVDHSMIEEWFKNNYASKISEYDMYNITDAYNFFRVIHAIEELTGKKGAYDV